ncbi:LytR C-terminal domain-containing protein [Salisaeta longa]|uniref:LytR C-terminal domain-containing protein n=1 Tax=Salisaeta longa TaxID=503170 RepID=UPI0003B642FD|nr:LytR C-terminal domain-containing protein [Salisaeta longa]
MRFSWRSLAAGPLLTVLIVVLAGGALVLGYAFVQQSLQPPSDPTRVQRNPTLVSDVIQVSVQNGCGVADVAERTTHFLRGRGFDVVQTGNYTSFGVARSKVIDRTGDLASARKVARALGIPTSRVVQDLAPGLYLDASVVLGRDYEQLRPFRGSRVAATALAP